MGDSSWITNSYGFGRRLSWPILKALSWPGFEQGISCLQTYTFTTILTCSVMSIRIRILVTGSYKCTPKINGLDVTGGTHKFFKIYQEFYFHLSPSVSFLYQGFIPHAFQLQLRNFLWPIETNRWSAKFESPLGKRLSTLKSFVVLLCLLPDLLGCFVLILCSSQCIITVLYHPKQRLQLI